MVVFGLVGIGKIFICCMKAVQWLLRGVIIKIIFIRVNVFIGKFLGVISGIFEEKFELWMMFMMDVFKEVLGKGFYEYCVKCECIQIVFFEIICGCSFFYFMILVDEV